MTQCRNLAEAETMVRDYVESLTGADAGNAAVVISPEVGGGLDEQARAARGDRRRRPGHQGSCRPVPQVARRRGRRARGPENRWVGGSSGR